MKHLALTILLLAILSELPLVGQLTERERMGAYSSGMSSYRSSPPKTETLADVSSLDWLLMPMPTRMTKAERNRAIAAAKLNHYLKRYISATNQLGGRVYANIQGKIYNMVKDGTWISGEVERKEDDGMLILTKNECRGAVRNYSGDGLTGKDVKILAVRTGTYKYADYNGQIIELWDCGKPLTPEQAKRQQIEDDKALTVIENAKADKAAAKQAKIDTAKAGAVKWNQEEADKGDSYGLLRMGERYRDGDGVEKDLVKAQEFLTKASAAGSSTATDALQKLNLSSLNAPTAQ